MLDYLLLTILHSAEHFLLGTCATDSTVVGIKHSSILVQGRVKALRHLLHFISLLLPLLSSALPHIKHRDGMTFLLTASS